MKKYWYAMAVTCLLTFGSSVKADAQSSPSGQINNGGNNDTDHGINYNYLGLIGLLGLYGLRKKQINQGTVIDRKA